MKTFFRIFRWPLGQLILLIDWLTRPSSPSFSPEKQAIMDASAAQMKLYHFRLCPFCVKTRRTIRRLGLKIETRDALRTGEWAQHLIKQGGKYQVPCLSIKQEDGAMQWIYESSVINQYLEQRFGQ